MCTLSNTFLGIYNSSGVLIEKINSRFNFLALIDLSVFCHRKQTIKNQQTIFTAFPADYCYSSPDYTKTAHLYNSRCVLQHLKSWIPIPPLPLRDRFFLHEELDRPLLAISSMRAHLFSKIIVWVECDYSNHFKKRNLKNKQRWVIYSIKIIGGLINLGRGKVWNVACCCSLLWTVVQFFKLCVHISL